MDIDDVYKEIGEFGPYQKGIFWSLALMQIFCAFHNIHNVFVGAQPAFKCIIRDEILDHCPKDGSSCEHHVFLGEDFSSIVSKVCSFSP